MALAEYGLVPHFVGEGADTIKIGRTFAAEILASETVLFPCSQQSRRTIQRQLAPSQVKDLITYNTVEVTDTDVPDVDVLVFTSPSNAASYLDRQPIESHQSIVVMGRTTASFLSEQGYSNTIVPWSSSELALADSILSL